MITLHDPVYRMHRSVDIEKLKSLSMEYFDKDGFALTELEQYIHRQQDVMLSQTLNLRSVAIPWCQIDRLIDGLSIKHPGLMVDHAFISARYKCGGSLANQIHLVAQSRPCLWKLVHLQPKCGLDVSIDYTTKSESFEVLHLEYDFASLDTLEGTMAIIERTLSSTWWGAAINEARTSKERGGLSDDISDANAKMFGFERAYKTLKVVG